jgi:membrane-associated protein
MAILDDAAELATRAGPFLPWLLALAALAEYVFPPFPGDTITLVGAAFAIRGEVPAWVVFAACTAGSAVGAALDYGFGVWLEARIEEPAMAARFARWVPPDRLARIEAQYRRWGPWLIAANRFVPVSRAFFFVFAGMSRLGLAKTMILGTLLAAVWNALLIAVAYQVGANTELLAAWFDRVNRAAFVVVTMTALAVLLVLFVRSRRRR